MTHNILLRKVNCKDLVDLSTLHLESLPDDYLSLLGRNFLQNIYYPNLLKSSNVALVSIANNKITGFIFFNDNDSFFKDLVINNCLIILKYALHKCTNLSFIRYSFIVLMLLLFSPKQFQGAELCYMAVSIDYRKVGIGEQLVKQGLFKLHELGVKNVWVKTLKSTNETIKFYKTLGFDIVCERFDRVFLQRSTNIHT